MMSLLLRSSDSFPVSHYDPTNQLPILKFSWLDAVYGDAIPLRARPRRPAYSVFASVQKLFPVEIPSSNSLSEISLFGGQCPLAGLIKNETSFSNFTAFVPTLCSKKPSFPIHNVQPELAFRNNVFVSAPPRDEMRVFQELDNELRSCDVPDDERSDEVSP